VTSELDVITVPALYSDRRPLPSDYTVRLQNAANQGGYPLTHVLLAWIWLQENGGEVQLPQGFIESLYTANAEIVEREFSASDLPMEAATFLYLAGQGARVADGYVQRVLASQGTDGGWGEGDNEWHTTTLGLLLLLQVEFPSDAYPPMLAPASAQGWVTPETVFATGCSEQYPNNP
jgi:hypothetical protein